MTPQQVERVNTVLSRHSERLVVRNRKLYVDALRVGSPSSERMEFLGDAVLGLVTAHSFYEHDVSASEGDMTRRRSDAVRGSTLSALAVSSGVSTLLPPEVSHNLSAKILEDALESFVAAIYLDNDLDRTSEWFLNALASHRAFPDDVARNSRSVVRTWCHENGRKLRMHFSSAGKDYLCAAEMDNVHVGLGKGSTRRQSEDRAYDEVQKYIGMITVIPDPCATRIGTRPALEHYPSAENPCSSRTT